MSLPICDICAKTGVMCNACDAKLRNKEISDLDIEISKIIYDLGNGEFSFDRSFDMGDFVVLMTNKREVGKIIGKNATNLRELSSKLGKKVRIIGTGNLEDVVYDFVAPAQILGINTVFKTDGSTSRRVIINKKDENKLKIGVGTIEELISSFADDRVEISFG